MRRRCAQLCSGLRCHELSPLTFRPRYRPLPPSPPALVPPCYSIQLHRRPESRHTGCNCAGGRIQRAQNALVCIFACIQPLSGKRRTDELHRYALSLCVCLYGEEFSTSVSTLAKLCLPGKRLRDGLIFVIALGASRMDGAEECRGMKGIIGIRLFSKRVFERGDPCLDYVNGVPKFTRCNFDRKHTGL